MLDELLAQESTCLLVVLLDNLVEAGVVELCEKGEVVNICNDDGETFF